MKRICAVLIIMLTACIGWLNAAEVDREVVDRMTTAGEADYFLVFHEKADLTGADLLRSKIDKGRHVVNTLKQVSERSQRDVRSWLDEQHIAYRSFWIDNMILVHSGREILDALARNPDITRIVPDHKRRIIRDSHLNPKPSPLFASTPRSIQPLPPAPNPSRSVEWNISHIQADRVWETFNVRGEGITVCDFDTGVDWQHSALKSHYRGWNGSTADHNYNWFDATGTSPTEPIDDHGHGTHPTGTMIGDDGAGNQIGVAPDANWIAVKFITANDEALDSWILAGFQWVLAPTDLNGQNPDPAKAPHIVNNSWGIDSGTTLYYDAVQALVEAGIFMEFSAGNAGPGCETVGSPGDYDTVITTGALMPLGVASDFSARGPSRLSPSLIKPDVCAPGEQVRSSVPGEESYGEGMGTSMAGPHVCGMAALMWSANPALQGRVEDTIELIRETCITARTPECTSPDTLRTPNNVYGWGEIDCFRAVAVCRTPQSAAWIGLGKPTVGCSDSIEILLADADLISAGVLSVEAFSSTETQPETVQLDEIMPGVFYGITMTGAGQPLPDGKVQVSESDLLTVRYDDQNHGGAPETLSAGATVDCTGPEIVSVTILERTSTSATILWQTSEPATTEIGFGETTPVTPCLSIAHFETMHYAHIPDLESCTDYFYSITARDAAGNEALTTLDASGSIRTLERVYLMDATMDTDPGWDREGDWEWGVPAGLAGDPSSGFTGANVLGYNLDGAYENNMPRYCLTTPRIDCGKIDNIYVEIALWLNVGAYPDDQASWELSLDGGASWMEVMSNAEYQGPVEMDGWMHLIVPASDFLAGQSKVKFRWVIGPTDSDEAYGGWNLDDFRVYFERECETAATPTPGVTPTPSAPPTAAPSSTPTSAPHGVTLTMPSHRFSPGDACSLTATICNRTAAPLDGIPFFTLLSFQGQYWFYPSWTQSADWITLATVPTGSIQRTIIPEFTWPASAGAISGLSFIAAMTDPSISRLEGTAGVWEFDAIP